MRHPKSRSERRYNGEIWRDRNRFIMKNVWHQSSYRPEDLTSNRMWWARKQCVGHGNRCMCNIKKIEERRARRRALDQAIIDNINSFEE